MSVFTKMVTLCSLLAVNSTLYAAAALPEVFEISTTSKTYSTETPWNITLDNAVGAGFLVEGNHILTNAHVVQNAGFITVRSNASAKLYPAEIEAIANEVDLALLKVNDKSFFEGKTPLPLGELPNLAQEVMIYGYPGGGNHVSVTRGIISRIEYRSYKNSDLRYQSIQVDAAINIGDSGGPAMVDGKVVGVAAETDKDYENTGYLVPVTLIRQFLKDMEDGKQDGFPWFTAYFQTLANPALRAKYNLKSDQSGVVIRSYCSGSDAATKLTVDTVITHIDGHEIADNGLVKQGDLYMDFQHYIDTHQVGDTVALTVWDGSKSKVVEIKLDQRITPDRAPPSAPRYFIFGGYIFTASKQLPGCENTTEKETKAEQQEMEKPTSSDKVELSEVLRSTSNMGFYNAAPSTITKVNGKRFNTFKEFYDLLHSATTDLLTLDTADGNIILIDRKQALAEQNDLLKRYEIPKAASAEFDHATP